MTNLPLTVELNPKGCWLDNVKSHVSKEEWDIIRKKAYVEANYRCEICSGKGFKWPVECHELWNYDDENKLKTLVKMTALCPNCHKAKHIARYASFGQVSHILRHISRVNRWTEKESEAYLQKEVDLWSERSKYLWKVNIDVLSDYFIETIKDAEYKPMIGEIEW